MSPSTDVDRRHTQVRTKGVEPRHYPAVEQTAHDRAHRRVADGPGETGQRPQTGTEWWRRTRSQVGRERRKHQPPNITGLGHRHGPPAVGVHDDHVGPYVCDRAPQIIDFDHRAPAQHIQRRLEDLERVTRQPVPAGDGLDPRVDRLGVKAGAAHGLDFARQGAQVDLVPASGQFAQQCAQREQMAQRGRPIGQDHCHVRYAVTKSESHQRRAGHADRRCRTRADRCEARR